MRATRAFAYPGLVVQPFRRPSQPRFHHAGPCRGRNEPRMVPASATHRWNTTAFARPTDGQPGTQGSVNIRGAHVAATLGYDDATASRYPLNLGPTAPRGPDMGRKNRRSGTLPLPDRSRDRFTFSRCVAASEGTDQGVRLCLVSKWQNFKTGAPGSVSTPISVNAEKNNT